MNALVDPHIVKTITSATLIDISSTTLVTTTMTTTTTTTTTTTSISISISSISISVSSRSNIIFYITKTYSCNIFERFFLIPQEL